MSIFQPDNAGAEAGDERVYTPAELRALENPPEGWTECGCCGCYHPAGYTDDCRNDAMRW